MAERVRRDELQVPGELRINPLVIEALRGEISDPIRTISHKPGSEGEMVEVRLVKEGPGLFGLSDWRDSREWAGITSHVLLSARYAVYFAQRLANAGHDVNAQRILDGMIVSHPGRRQWDEAFWYPEAVKDAKAKRSISNETLGMRLIQGKVPQEAFELVVALGHDVEGFSVDPAIYQSWDFKVAIYVDHRTGQSYESLNTRMGVFLLGNFFRKEDVTPQLREKVYKALGEMIERQKNFRLGKEGVEQVSLDEADQIAGELGANPNSERLSRSELMRLILQDADTEAGLIAAGIDPSNVNDETVPMPAWEDEFRKTYVLAARESIMEEVWMEILDLPSSDTWWFQYARKMVLGS